MRRWARSRSSPPYRSINGRTTAGICSGCAASSNQVKMMRLLTLPARQDMMPWSPMIETSFETSRDALLRMEWAPSKPSSTMIYYRG
eukprot:8398044-Pyramimonas_sp.AAC.1